MHLKNLVTLFNYNRIIGGWEVLRVTGFWGLLALEKPSPELELTQLMSLRHLHSVTLFPGLFFYSIFPLKVLRVELVFYLLADLDCAIDSILTPGVGPCLSM